MELAGTKRGENNHADDGNFFLKLGICFKSCSYRVENSVGILQKTINIIRGKSFRQFVNSVNSTN